MADDLTTQLIKERESFRSKPYWDVNAYRIGYGSDTVTDEDGTVHKVTSKTRTTRAAADRDLARRIPEFQAQGIIPFVGADVWDTLGEGAQAGITSLAYNYGSLEELPSLQRAIRSGDNQAIADAILKREDDNDGINAERRRIEANIVLGHPTPRVGIGIDDAVRAVGAAAPAELPPLPRARPGTDSTEFKPLPFPGRLQTPQPLPDTRDLRAAQFGVRGNKGPTPLPVMTPDQEYFAPTGSRFTLGEMDAMRAPQVAAQPSGPLGRSIPRSTPPVIATTYRPITATAPTMEETREEMRPAVVRQFPPPTVARPGVGIGAVAGMGGVAGGANGVAALPAAAPTPLPGNAVPTPFPRPAASTLAPPKIASPASPSPVAVKPAPAASPAKEMVRLPSGKMAELGTYTNPTTGNLITVSKGANGSGMVQIHRKGFVDLGSEMNAPTILGGIIRSKVPEAIQGAASNLMPTVKNAASDAINSVTSQPIVKNVTNTIGGAFGGLMGLLPGGQPAQPTPLPKIAPRPLTPSMLLRGKPTPQPLPAGALSALQRRQVQQADWARRGLNEFGMLS